MRHRELEAIPAAVLDSALRRTPLEHYVIWTGHDPTGHDDSMRRRSLACVKEAWTPVSLRWLIQQAARLGGDLGYHPDAVRSAVRAHQGARPAVYLLLERTAAGALLAVTDIPFPAHTGARIRAGDVVLEASPRMTARPFQLRAAS